MSKDIPCSFYYYLHFILISMLLEKNTDIISVKEWEDGMFQYRIPKDLRGIMTRELEMMGLIKRVGNRELKIFDSKYNPSDLRCFKKAVGLI